MVAESPVASRYKCTFKMDVQSAWALSQQRTACGWWWDSLYALWVAAFLYDYPMCKMQLNFDVCLIQTRFPLCRVFPACIIILYVLLKDLLCRVGVIMEVRISFIR